MTNCIDVKVPDRLFVIIPAAGQGRRMGSMPNKQFIPVGGIPVLARTLLLFEQFLADQKKSGLFSIHGVLVTTPESISDAALICTKYGITFVEKIVQGGLTRQESVWNGICALSLLESPPKDNDVIFIHDGARCFAETDIFRRCLAAASKYGVCAAAVPVKDTIKQVDSDGSCRVVSTPARDILYAVQTPQAFLYPLLFTSYSEAINKKREATDDTSLAEMAGLPVYLVEGSYLNIKITTPEDLLWADLLKNRQTPASP
jgi:2-C-methyl-D-erythritol 4-phosphate cytidylyltransferase